MSDAPDYKEVKEIAPEEPKNAIKEESVKEEKLSDSIPHKMSLAEIIAKKKKVN